MDSRYFFETQRLFVNDYANQGETIIPETQLAEIALKILTLDVTKALPAGWQNINTPEKAKKWLRERYEESQLVTIECLPTKEIIGFLFLRETATKQDERHLRFGYLLSENMWGKGLGTELVKGLIEWCKASGDVALLSGGVERNNIASIRVLEKTGFSPAKMDDTTEQTLFYEYAFEIKKSYK